MIAPALAGFIAHATGSLALAARDRRGQPPFSLTTPINEGTDK